MGERLAVCFTVLMGLKKPKAPVLPRPCAVGKGHKLHAGTARQSHPPAKHPR